MAQTLKGKKAEEYCAKFPNMANNALAKKLYNDTGLFSSVENARNRVRYYRGQDGDAHRQSRLESNLLTANGDERRGNSSTVAPSIARILVFDIETSPHMAYVWQCLKAYISPEQMIDHSRILCWAAKWLGEDEVFFERVKNVEDDKECCSKLRDLFDEADVVVAHNGRAFDIKTLNTRWLANGLNPPMPYKNVDTCKLAQAKFRFPRAKLDSIARYLGIGTKQEHEGFDLWTKCINGDKKAWKTMEAYNKQDVLLLEEVYLALRAWDSQHPNVSICADDIMRCTVCGSSAIRELNKTAKTAASEFPSYRCESCGHVMRRRKRFKPCRDTSEQLANAQ